MFVFTYYSDFLLVTSVPDQGSGAFLTPGSGMGKKTCIRIRDEQPGSYFRELRKNFLDKKYLNSLMRIWDPEWEKFGPGMEKIGIRDPG